MLTLLVGLPGAYALSRYRFRGRNVVRAAVTVPFVLPTVVVGSAFLALLGPRGPLGLDLRRTVAAILLAHIFFNYAVVVRTVGGLWQHLDPRLEDAARVLGAGRWQAFREVTLPLLRPAIAASAAIVFLFTFTSFGVVLILGGPGRATLEVEIHRATTQLLNLPLASALALLQLAAVVAALTVYGRLQRRVPQRLVAADVAARPPRTVGARVFLAANLLFMLVLVGAPLLVLLERSFAVGDGYGLAAWRALLGEGDGTLLAVDGAAALRRSLVLGAVAALLAVVVGGLAATGAVLGRGRGAGLVDRALMVPLGTSAVTVGFGFLIALDSPPLDLRGSVVLVPIAQALVAIPFVVRTLLPVLRGHRRAAARGRGHAGRDPPPGVARGRPADRGPRAAGGGGLRVRDRGRRVRGHGVRGPRAAPHAAGRDRAPAGPPGRGELRAGDGPVHGPGRDHRGRRSS